MLVEHGSLYWYAQGLLTSYQDKRIQNRYTYLSGSMTFEEYAKYNSFYTAQIQLMNHILHTENPNIESKLKSKPTNNK